MTASRIAQAHRIAASPSENAAKKPSPAVSISRPPCFRSSLRITEWCLAWSTFHRRSPSSDAIAVEPTMSVKRTIAKAVSLCRGDLGMNQLGPVATRR